MLAFPFCRREALKSIMSVFESVIPIRPQFLESLAAIDSIVLQGSLFVDLSITAYIPANVISDSSYGDIDVTVMINSFEVTAELSAETFSVELPITLPSGRQVNKLKLSDASFSRDVFVRALTSVNIAELFHDDPEMSVNLEFGGAFDAVLPVTIGMAGANFVVDFTITHDNIFESDPLIDYAINLCDISDLMTDLFDQLKDQIVAAVRAPFGDKPVLFVSSFALYTNNYPSHSIIFYLLRDFYW